MTDKPLNVEDEEDDDFFITGTVIIQAGCNGEGELLWRYKYEDIEPALVLGFLDVIRDEVKADIKDAIRRDDEDD